LPVFLVEIIRVNLGRVLEIEVGRQDAVAFQFAEVFVPGLEAGHVEAFDLVEPGTGSFDVGYWSGWLLKQHFDD